MLFPSYLFKKIIPIKTIAIMTKGIHKGQPAIALATKSATKTSPAIFSAVSITITPFVSIIPLKRSGQFQS